MKQSFCAARVLAALKPAGMSVLVLTFGLIIAGCPHESSGGSKFDGTWEKGSYRVVIKGTGYTILLGGDNVQKGTFSYNDQTVSFTATHEWEDSSWVGYSYTTSTYDYTLGGNILTLSLRSAPNEWDQQFSGKWDKQ